MGIGNAHQLAAAPDGAALPDGAAEGVDPAREASLERVVLSIVGGDAGAYGRLEEHALNTVADLAAFEGVGSVLEGRLGEEASGWVGRAVRVMNMEGMEWVRELRMVSDA
jgi:hypothetical protein